jgi:hypothetical protein
MFYEMDLPLHLSLIEACSASLVDLELDHEAFGEQCFLLPTIKFN